MSDRTKTCLSLMSFAAMIALPLVGLAVGWIGWDWRVGTIAALVVFVVCFVLYEVLLVTVQDLSWWRIGVPYLLGFVYTVLPDAVLGPFDDVATFVAGAAMTFILWLRKRPRTPRWIVYPLLASALYPLAGGFIPGPIDELLVTVIGSGVAIVGAARKPGDGSTPRLASDDDVIDAEFQVREGADK